MTITAIPTRNIVVIECPACNFDFIFFRQLPDYVARITAQFLDHDIWSDHGFLLPEDRDNAIRELIAQWEVAR